jgi:hypothetical protein
MSIIQRPQNQYSEGDRLNSDLDRALARLNPADREIIERQLSPSFQRRRRLDERDDAWRELGASPRFFTKSVRAMADRTTSAVSRYAAGAYRFERGPPADPDRRIMFKILQLNRGKSLSSAHVRRILAGLSGA